MPIDPQIATEVAKTIAKEVYGDAFAPATREFGAALGDLANAMRAAGLEFGAITRERIIRIFERAALQVPYERRLLPPPQVLGPVLEGVRYEPDGTPITEMWEALLARSMDADRIGEAHPAFSEIIKRLSPDEVRLLKYLRREPITGPWEEINFHSYSVDLLVPPEGLLDRPQSFGLYRMNLSSLDLIGHQEVRLEGEPNTGGRLQMYMFPYGEAFVDACTPAH